MMIDANAGESYYAKVKPDSRLHTAESPYLLSISTVSDPGEPNDSLDQATFWDYAAGPTQGYFADQVSGWSDHYEVAVPATVASGSLTARLQDVPADVEPRLAVYNSAKRMMASDSSSDPGQTLELDFDVQGGQTYYVRVTPKSRLMVSDQPYTLLVVGYE